MKQFYADLVEMETIIVELDKLNLSKEEKLHLAHLAEDSLHHTVLDAILSHLSAEDKRVFMMHVTSEDHEKIWKFLNEKIDKVEDKIKQASVELKSKLHKDLKEAGKLK